MKLKSSLFLNAKRGTPGRRAARRLNDCAVARARLKSADPAHQMKFVSAPKRLLMAIRPLIEKAALQKP